MTGWYTVFPDHVHISVLAKPKARRNANLGVSHNALRIALQAAPCDGDANKMLVSYLAELLDLPRSQVILVRGNKSRHKLVKVPYSATVQLFLETCENNPLFYLAKP